MDLLLRFAQGRILKDMVTTIAAMDTLALNALVSMMGVLLGTRGSLSAFKLLTATRSKRLASRRMGFAFMRVVPMVLTRTMDMPHCLDRHRVELDFEVERDGGAVEGINVGSLGGTGQGCRYDEGGKDLAHDEPLALGGTRFIIDSADDTCLTEEGFARKD